MKRWLGWVIIIVLSVMIGGVYLGAVYVSVRYMGYKSRKIPYPVILEDDFEGKRQGHGYWSVEGKEVVPVKGRAFLGPFESDEVVLQLLPEIRRHDTVTVSFDLYIFGPWQGNGNDPNGKPDLWELAVEQGPTLVRTTFLADDKKGQTQAYPDNYPEGRHPARTGAKGVLPSSGRTTTSPIGAGSIYHMSFTFPHNQYFLILRFRGEISNSSKEETCGWGLDNVKVTLDNRPKVAKGIIPRGKPGVDREGMSFRGTLETNWFHPSIIFEDRPELLDLRDSLTVSAWVRCGDYADGGIFWRGLLPEGEQYSLCVVEDKMRFRVATGPPGEEHEVITREPVDQLWHFWTGVCDKKGGQLRLYCDGILQGQVPFQGYYRYDATSEHAFIASKACGNGRFEGEIAEVQVWKTVRSSKQIINDRLKTPSGREPGLVASWVLYKTPEYTIQDMGSYKIRGTIRTQENPKPSW